MTPFEGRTAIVTGGASGIGRALGAELARHGARVVLADLDGAAAERAAAELAARGGAASAAALDVTDAGQVEDLVRRVQGDHGRLDLMFNNAGISMVGEARDLTLAAWHRILDVNLYGVIHGTQAAYPVMIEQRSGHIVNTASIAGLVPLPLGIAYNASKFAVVGLSLTLRAEARGHGVRVSVACPGFIDTPLKDSLEYVNLDKQAAMRELPFRLRPADECARAILRGVARDRGVIVITAEARALWYLSRLAPRLTVAIGALAARRSQKLRLP
ncbi:MAG: SDR family oxidoreductase [Deltaproteobacteria bacterium]|nr:SDR family oxidoreductase [Deltaproteobacteria bacterium]